jgi:hypothetical protein
MKSRTEIAVAIIGIALLACLLSACGKETPPSTLTAHEVIGRCMESMDAADSFHFRLEHDGGGTPIAGGLTMNEAEGDIARPDRLKVQTWVEMIGLGDMKVEFITVGSAIYMTNPFTDEWEPLPTDFSAVSFFDPDTGVTAILEGMTGPAILEEEKVKGLRCYHIKGRIASQCLNSIALSSVEGAVIDTEVWIGTEDFLLRRIRLEGQITEDEKAEIVRTITLSDFDQSVEIELPE